MTQLLSTVARTAGDQPGLVAGAHRAVAADPERLLPLAAQTVTAELGTDQARQWLTGLEHAVADRAAHPDADPDTYQWANNLISGAQERTIAERNDLEDLIGAPPTQADTLEPAAPSPDSHLVLVKPQVGWLTRYVVGVLGLGHLTLVGAVATAAALKSNVGDDGWVQWLFVPMNIFLHLTVASAFGGRQLGTVLFAWIVPLFAIGLTTSTAFMIDRPWPADWPPQWLLWPTLFAFGLTALTFAWRFELGQLQDTRPSPVSEDRPE
ncbi:hypothetical protein [Streptomyces sp. NPDC050263]|uniref:hypothetical protein n=1 Tax=Streptomyces sp. NPDC050263 TaxID=3155037 RepID=UPI00343C867B